VIPFYYGSRTVTIITVLVPLRFVIKLRFQFRYGKKLRFLSFRFLKTAADVEQRIGCGSTLVRENSGSRSRSKKSGKRRNFLFVFFNTLDSFFRSVSGSGLKVSDSATLPYGTHCISTSYSSVRSFFSKLAPASRSVSVAQRPSFIARYN
jgi:hypothetical protein